MIKNKVDIGLEGAICVDSMFLIDGFVAYVVNFPSFLMEWK